jgi:hypothetical protein
MVLASAIAIAALVACALTVAWFLRSFDEFFNGKLTTYRGTKAESFFHSEVEALLKLPPGTKIRRLDHTQDFVDDFYVLTVTTNSDLPPEKWVKNLWADNRFAPNSKVGPYEYSSYQSSSLHHGHRRVCYDVESGSFVIEVGTD